MDSNGLYIHIPFCQSKCIYCNFLSFTGDESTMQRYVDALIAQMQLYKKATNGKVFDTVYIGGGTPGVLPPFLLHKIFEGVRSCFVLSKDAEVTIEINPSSATTQKAQAFAQCGINRVSIGLQSINDKQLKQLGRSHTKDDFLHTVKLVKDAGITNISADLLLGLEGQTKQEIFDAVQMIASLGLTHISAYALKVERGTALSKLVRAGKMVLPDDDATVDLYDFAVEALASCGFERYEVSNFCRTGFQSKHNVNCWRCKDYLGLGLGAHSCMFGKRFCNVTKMENYIAKVEAQKLPVSSSHRLTDAERLDERIMLGLRLKEGVEIESANREFGIDITQNKSVKKWLKQGVLLSANGWLRLAESKFYIMNSVLCEIICDNKNYF